MSFGIGCTCCPTCTSGEDCGVEANIHWVGQYAFNDPTGATDQKYRTTTLVVTVNGFVSTGGATPVNIVSTTVEKLHALFGDVYYRSETNNYNSQSYLYSIADDGSGGTTATGCYLDPSNAGICSTDNDKFAAQMNASNTVWAGTDRLGAFVSTATSGGGLIKTDTYANGSVVLTLSDMYTLTDALANLQALIDFVDLDDPAAVYYWDDGNAGTAAPHTLHVGFGSDVLVYAPNYTQHTFVSYRRTKPSSGIALPGNILIDTGSGPATGSDVRAYLLWESGGRTTGDKILQGKGKVCFISGVHCVKQSTQIESDGTFNTATCIGDPTGGAAGVLKWEPVYGTYGTGVNAYAQIAFHYGTGGGGCCP